MVAWGRMHSMMGEQYWLPSEKVHDALHKHTSSATCPHSPATALPAVNKPDNTPQRANVSAKTKVKVVVK
jgi:hypothetical protein